jgi:transcription elongation factor SPT6
LYNSIKVASYQSDQQLDDDDDDADSHGLRVMGIAYSTDRNEAAYAACIDRDGEVSDFMRLTHILNRRAPRGSSMNYREKDKV